jgi:hypothetical protein
LLLIFHLPFALRFPFNNFMRFIFLKNPLLLLLQSVSLLGRKHKPFLIADLSEVIKEGSADLHCYLLGTISFQRSAFVR